MAAELCRRFIKYIKLFQDENDAEIIIIYRGTVILCRGEA